LCRFLGRVFPHAQFVGRSLTRREIARGTEFGVKFVVARP